MECFATGYVAIPSKSITYHSLYVSVNSGQQVLMFLFCMLGKRLTIVTVLQREANLRIATALLKLQWSAAVEVNLD